MRPTSTKIIKEKNGAKIIVTDKISGKSLTSTVDHAAIKSAKKLHHVDLIDEVISALKRQIPTEKRG